MFTICKFYRSLDFDNSISHFKTPLHDGDCEIMKELINTEGKHEDEITSDVRSYD